MLGNTPTVMVDVKGGNNLIYLPLDKLAPQTGNKVSKVPAASLPKYVQQPKTRTDTRARSSFRGRETRGRVAR